MKKLSTILLLFLLGQQSFAATKLQQCSQNPSGSYVMDYTSPSNQTMHAIFSTLKACQAARRNMLQTVDCPVQIRGCGKETVTVGSTTSQVFRGAAFQLECDKEFIFVEEEQLYDSLDDCEYYVRP